MDYNSTETMEHGGLKERASHMMDDVRSRTSQYMEREPRSTPRTDHREGILARSIEQQTARVPSDAWLWAAIGSMGLSLAFELTGKEKTANFIGHWVPSLLIFGLYNKMVKLHGSDPA